MHLPQVWIGVLLVKTVGIYIYSDTVKQRTAKKRDTYFDGQNFIGVRYIASEIDKTKYTVKHITKAEIDDVDFVLLTITSYYDILNVINELYGVKHRSKIIAGGAGLSNIDVLADIIDYAIIGRGECLINDILAGRTPDGVWCKSENNNFATPIKIQTLKEYIEIEDPILGMYKEESVGCSRKCFFCEYSWKNKFVAKDKNYSSGVADRETFFQDIDWCSYKNKDLVSAVDGLTEGIRKIINKPIKNSEITDKIMQIYDSGKDYLSLKLYCLVGYPFEKGLQTSELFDTIGECNGKGSNRLNIVIVSPHFMPMPFTPMECEPLNKTNYRDLVGRLDMNKYQNGNIKIYYPQMTTSAPANAAEATVLHRAARNQTAMIKTVLCSSKYKSLSSDMKVKTIDKYFPGILDKVESVVPYIERNYNTDNAKEVYYRRVEQYAGTKT